MSGARWSRGGPPPVAVAVVVAVVQVIGSVGAARWHHASLTPFAVALLLVGPAAIAGLRRWPLAPVAVSIAAAVTYASLDFPIGPIFVAPVAALWLEFIRSRLDRWAGMRREQALARDRQATEERVAIARELHDVIGHSLSLINVHAGVALHLLEGHPENARPALTTIKAVSHDALEEGGLGLGTVGGAGNPPARRPRRADHHQGGHPRCARGGAARPGHAARPWQHRDPRPSPHTRGRGRAYRPVRAGHHPVRPHGRRHPWPPTSGLGRGRVSRGSGGHDERTPPRPGRARSCQDRL